MLDQISRSRHIQASPVHSAEEAAHGINPGYTWAMVRLEQFSKGAVTDARSDVYSLGMTLHFLLTGVDPTQQVDQAVQAGTF